jgi:hypothetical protein
MGRSKIMSDIQSRINEQKSRLMDIRNKMQEKNIPDRVVDKFDKIIGRLESFQHEEAKHLDK